MLANQDDTFIGNLEAGFSSMLSFVWFYLDLDLPTWQNIQGTGPCSCSPSLLPSTISHRRLANVLFVFYYLTFHPLFSGANQALRRIANEDRKDRSKVLVCVIHLAYRMPAFSVSKKPSENEACSYFLVWPLSILQACGSLHSKRSL